MLYNIEGKNINIILRDEKIILPEKLRKKIIENFENVKKSGANIWNGDIICVLDLTIDNSTVNLECKKSNYAHCLYCEHIGCPIEYECRNLSGGCFLETIDGYYVIGELDDTTSYPGMLQTPGGGIDKKDIIEGKINVEQTILRETMEEINIDLNNRNIVLYNKLKYLFVSGKNEHSCVRFFSKAQLKMTAFELEQYFNEYNRYLRENNLEVEFKKIHFLKKERALSELEKLNKHFREYINPLIQANL